MEEEGVHFAELLWASSLTRRVVYETKLCSEWACGWMRPIM